MDLNTTGLTIVLGALAIICIKIIKWLYDYFYQVWVFSHINGPPIIPFIGNFLRLTATKSELLKAWFKIFDEYGKDSSFVRAWIGNLPVVVFVKSDDVETVFNDTRLVDKSFEYDLVHPWLNTGLLTSGGEKWVHRRKMLTPSFHFDILKDFLVIINEHAEVFVNTLKKLNRNEKIALKPYLSACSLDIICETAMGQNIKSQTGENQKYLQAVNNMTTLLTVRAITPWLWVKWIFKMSRYHKEQQDNLDILHGFTRKIISERNEGFSGLSTTNSKRIAFLDTLLDARLKDPNSITLEGIQEEVDTFMFEGHDTTTAALDWALFAIGTHPEAQKKLHEEIDSVLGTSNRPITHEDLNKLEYLECAIKESLRLYPPVPYFARIAKEDMMLGNKKILKGCTVGVSTLKIHRDERYFPEPEEFKPERFSSDNATKRPAFAYIPFSAGKRNCIGQRFAMQEVKVVLANILRNFTIECDQKYEELKPYTYMILRSENPILVKLNERV